MQLIRAIPILFLFLFAVLNSDKLIGLIKLTAQSLTLQQNLQNGSQLELSDGSLYEIAPSDRSKTTFWLTPITIGITASNDPMYPALLTNTISGVSVRAKQLRAATINTNPNPQL